MIAGALTLKWQSRLDQFSFGSTIMYSPRERGNLGWIIIPFGDLNMDASNGRTFFLARANTQVGGIIISDERDVSFDSSDGRARVDANFTAFILPRDEEPGKFIGEQEGSRFVPGQLSVSVSFIVEEKGIEFDINAGIRNAKLIISSAGRDGFIASILPDKPIEIPFNFQIGYSTQQSLYIAAGGGLELSLPVHITVLNILEIQEVFLKIKTTAAGLATEGSISGNVKLGPLAISFEQIGLRANLDWETANKNIGFADLSMNLKHPDGVGLSINAGTVSGGGFLRYDAGAEEYSGALELTIADLVSAKAIGIITTKMPDGNSGFSLLIIITAEFNPPYQLGYGFTLKGVGGLLGLNRTVLVDTLREGVRTGSVNSILFPQNVIANAPRIISDMKTVFPPQDGRFLIGPMAKLGWGSPTLITISFGLIIEIPGNIVILGVLRIVLPDQQKVLVSINVNFSGVLDFNKKLLSFDASLFDSRLLSMTLEGNMAVRLKWGDQPDFLLTVGGFHPDFTPPPLALPSLRRITISVLNSDNARLRFESYHAITSNTVQFGSRAELYFKFSGFSVEGHIGFDALFQFSPFVFMIDIDGHVSFKAFGVGIFGIRLQFVLQGPTPWRAKGRGGISFFFFSLSADFDKTWGETRDTSLPDIDLLPLLIAELNKPEQWQASLSFGKKLYVSLRELAATETALLMHPAGDLIVRQKLVPLDIDIDKLGNQKLSDIKNVGITAAESEGTDLSIRPVTGPFALAQYKVLSDADKLSRPSFEKLHDGVRISAEGQSIAIGKMTRRVVSYEEIIVDRDLPQPKRRTRPFLFEHFFAANAAAKSVLSRKEERKRQPFVDMIAVAESNFTVAFVDNNNAFNSGQIFPSEAMAINHMNKIIRDNPGFKEKLHVVGEEEINSN